MINILLAISTAGVGGGEEHLLTIAERLDKSRYNLFFLCPYAGDFSSELNRRGFKALVLNMPVCL
jgi:RNA:NAD 2'-phosphotransferase (TPT1/KptA family)